MRARPSVGCVQVPCDGLEVVSSTDPMQRLCFVDTLNSLLSVSCHQSSQSHARQLVCLDWSTASSSTAVAAPLFPGLTPSRGSSSMSLLRSAMDDVSFPSWLCLSDVFVADFILIPFLDLNAELPTAVRCQHQLVASACKKNSAASPGHVTDKETVKSIF